MVSNDVPGSPEWWWQPTEVAQDPLGEAGDGFRWEVGMEEGKDAEKVGLLVSLLTCS